MTKLKKTQRVPRALRRTLLPLALAAGPLRAQDIPRGLPAPGDGFEWERVGDYGVNARDLAFGPDSTLWATSPDGPCRLDTTQGFPGRWVLVYETAIFEGILPLGGDGPDGPGPDTLVASTFGTTRRSVDGGHTWTVVHDTGGTALFEIPPGLSHAGRVLVGDDGAIAYSDDRAASFTPSVVPDDGDPYNTAGAEAFAVLPAGSDYPGRILAAGTAGVSVSDDGGATFRKSGLWRYLYYRGEGVAAVEEPVGAAVAGGRINAQPHVRAWWSADGDETWLPEGGGTHLVEGPPNDGGAVAVLALGGERVLVVLGGGTIYQSGDAGQTWAPVGRAPEISTSIYANRAALGPDGRLYVGLAEIGSGDGWVWRTQERLTLPPVTVSVASPGRLVTVPPEGGAFPLRVTLTNAADEAQAVSAGTGVYLPDGTPYGPLVTRSVTVPAHGALTATITQHVPAQAPAGVYRYVAYTGSWPDALRESDELAFVKVAGAAPARGALDASAWSAEVAGVEAEEAQAASAGLGAEADGLGVSVSPNPARGAVTVALTVPEAEEVDVAVYDVLGRRVAVLASGRLSAGRHEFALDGTDLPAGVYVVRVRAGGKVRSQRLTLVR